MGSSGEKKEKEDEKEKKENKEEKNEKEKVPLYQYLEIEHEKKMKLQQQKLWSAPYQNNMNFKNKAPYLFPPQNGSKSNYMNNGYQQYTNNMNNNYNMNHLMNMSMNLKN